jgi:protein SCO1
MKRRAFLATIALALAACRKSPAEALPDLGLIPELSLTNQAGQVVRLANLHSEPLLVAFFFTRCPSVCPRLVARLKEMEASARSSKPVRVALISVDPEFDTPEVLRAYAEKHGLNGPAWSLLTGDYQKIAQAAEAGFKIGLSGKYAEDEPDLGITHGSHIVLVDVEGHIRKYIRSFDDDAIQVATLAVQSV